MAQNATTQLKKYKVRLNSSDNLQRLLQELYDEACKNIKQVQDEINKLVNSTNLAEEAMDAKARYAKAVNDFIASKDKAIGRKMDVAKLMSEVIKYNGNIKRTFEESDIVGDWSEVVAKADEMVKSDEKTIDERREYYIGK